MGGIFSINTGGSAYTNFFSFAFSDGNMPNGLLALTNGALYGSTFYGGLGKQGILYGLNSDGSGYTNLYNFTSASGGSPADGPILVGNALYGTTSAATTNGFGSIFAVNTNGSNFTNLFDNPGVAQSGLLLLNGTLYGTTTTYSTSGDIYAISTNGQNWNNLLSFSDASAGDVSYATLVASGNNLLYGTTEAGAANGSGAVFSIGTNGAPLNVVYSFSRLTYDAAINRKTKADG